ncbi:hypothetical protein [Piscicoccus intestinalis]|uniref:hypothetical protein n=1 Tax=Piscicoccus intestinalis TaxID=746033 RepID=UPI001FDFBBA9|nr:hypothetical protein [Piscicoccus intestinalis]
MSRICTWTNRSSYSSDGVFTDSGSIRGFGSGWRSVRAVAAPAPAVASVMARLPAVNATTIRRGPRCPQVRERVVVDAREAAFMPGFKQRSGVSAP